VRETRAGRSWLERSVRGRRAPRINSQGIYCGRPYRHGIDELFLQQGMDEARGDDAAAKQEHARVQHAVSAAALHRCRGHWSHTDAAAAARSDGAKRALV
jgi:hypothetical protein